ncbi:hypothetical protein [Bradyrhizobium centrolobii]|nr:hypothetical protein [Bradyrhizobium centrolobii]
MATNRGVDAQKEFWGKGMKKYALTPEGKTNIDDERPGAIAS